ncbi:hypothetical protein [Bifidobacterium porcinum]|nr:hypothetical protein [Bifidobacterium porcinum]
MNYGDDAPDAASMLPLGWYLAWLWCVRACIQRFRGTGSVHLAYL